MIASDIIKSITQKRKQLCKFYVFSFAHFSIFLRFIDISFF